MNKNDAADAKCNIMPAHGELNENKYIIEINE